MIILHLKIQFKVSKGSGSDSQSPARTEITMLQSTSLLSRQIKKGSLHFKEVEYENDLNNKIRSLSSPSPSLFS